MCGSRLSVVFSAPSGCGKSTIIHRLMDRCEMFEFVVSTTTRKKREHEVEGRDYYFVDDAIFSSMIEKDEFLEWAHVHTSRYGTSKKEIDRIHKLGKVPIFDIDTQGVKNLRGKIENCVYIFIIPPSMIELRKRLEGRGTETDEQISVRLSNAKKEISQYLIYDYVLINDVVDEAVKKIMSILQAELLKAERMKNEIMRVMEN